MRSGPRGTLTAYVELTDGDGVASPDVLVTGPWLPQRLVDVTVVLERGGTEASGHAGGPRYGSDPLLRRGCPPSIGRHQVRERLSLLRCQGLRSLVVEAVTRASPLSNRKP